MIDKHTPGGPHRWSTGWHNSISLNPNACMISAQVYKDARCCCWSSAAAIVWRTAWPSWGNSPYVSTKSSPTCSTYEKKMMTLCCCRWQEGQPGQVTRRGSRSHSYPERMTARWECGHRWLFSFMLQVYYVLALAWVSAGSYSYHSGLSMGITMIFIKTWTPCTYIWS
jgi:hypothetical protein